MNENWNKRQRMGPDNQSASNKTRARIIAASNDEEQKGGTALCFGDPDVEQNPIEIRQARSEIQMADTEGVTS